MSSLASAAAAFEADKIAEMEPKAAIRKLYFEMRRMGAERADDRNEIRSLRRRVDRLEGIKLPRS